MDASPPTQDVVSASVSWGMVVLWGFLGLLGAGIKVGIELGKGTPVNKWHIGTSLVAGGAMAATSTQGVVNMLGVEYGGLAGLVALLTGLMAIGFMVNALEGRIPLLNRFMGGNSGA